MPAELKSEFVIDGIIVEKDAKLHDLIVFKKDYGESIMFYFVDANTNKVIKTLTVVADCGQNQGYINGHAWRDS